MPPSSVLFINVCLLTLALRPLHIKLETSCSIVLITFPGNTTGDATCHLANFSTVCRQKACWEFFIRRVVDFLELINENSEYSKCKNQERTS